MGLIIIGSIVDLFEDQPQPLKPGVVLGPPSNPAAPAPAAPSPVTGNDVCEAWESFGNKAPGWSQRCTFAQIPSSGGQYTLTFKGDYGDDELLLAVAMVRKLEELDRRMSTRGTAIQIMFPDGAAKLHGAFTVPREKVTECRLRGDDADQRLCVLETLLAGMKRAG